MMKKTRPGLGLLSAVLILLFGCSALSGCFVEKEPIRIGVNCWPPCEVWYVADQQGFFGDVEVELIRYSTWIDNMSNFYKGNSDISHASYFNALYFSDKGENAKIVLTSDTVLGSDGLVVRESMDLPEGLKGTRIAVEVNTDEQFLLTKALQKYGLTEADITIIPATSEQAMDLFIAGEADGCSTYDPYLTMAAEQGNGKVVWTTKEDPGYMEDVLVAGEEVLTKREKDLRKVINAWYKALDYIRENPDSAYPLMAGNESMAPEDFGPFFESFHFYTQKENLDIFSSPEFPDRLKEMIVFLDDHRTIEKDIKPADVFEAKIIEGLK